MGLPTAVSPALHSGPPRAGIRTPARRKTSFGRGRLEQGRRMRGLHLRPPVRERAVEGPPELPSPGERPVIEDAVDDEAAVQDGVPALGEAPEAIRRDPEMPAVVEIAEKAGFPHVRAPSS